MSHAVVDLNLHGTESKIEETRCWVDDDSKQSKSIQETAGANPYEESVPAASLPVYQVELGLEERGSSGPIYVPAWAEYWKQSRRKWEVGPGHERSNDRIGRLDDEIESAPRLARHLSLANPAWHSFEFSIS
nr:uncharacterized protein CTRU02_07063 [Colletotrichum truncatum]KAF6791879.1 hypothetical protein CTRU02_07063 [Colletotrichum truncatum]